MPPPWAGSWARHINGADVREPASSAQPASRAGLAQPSPETVTRTAIDAVSRSQPFNRIDLPVPTSGAGSVRSISVTKLEVSAMGKVMLIGAIVLVVWAGMEIQTKGVEGAFNGLFAPAGQEEAEAITSTPQRAGDRVRDALQQGEERNNRMLREISQ